LTMTRNECEKVTPMADAKLTMLIALVAPRLLRSGKPNDS